MDDGATAKELRGDIQGLRAVAVLVVIAGHAGVPFLPGGFVGVDVFYVISGYLIATLLYREVMLTGTVSVGAFWARRARRILPAATLVTVVTVLLALLWMSLLDAREVVVDALWASAFAANVHFAQQGVFYFAQDTGPSPLQHYWSLAVEEQFYVVWPLLLLGCLWVAHALGKGDPVRRGGRLPRRSVMTMLVVISLASLAWSVHQTEASPATAYFSTLTRAWELGVGALVALLPRTHLRHLTRLGLETMAVVGAVLLLAACLLFTPETPFPGVAAMLPVIGAALIIVSGSVTDAPGKQTLCAKVLAVAPARMIGDWSYSLYLWHWPALVLPPIAMGRQMTAFEKVIAVLVVVTLSAYSYRFVEMPFRSGRPAHRLRRQALVLYPASATLVVAVAAGAWWWTTYQGGEHGDNPPITVAGAPVGELPDNTEALVRASVLAARDRRAVPSDLTPDLLNLRSSIADVGACDYHENVRRLCPRGEGDRTLVVIGDSHARAWIPAFNRIMEAGGWRAYYLVKPQCPAAHVTVASLGDDEPFTDCSDFQDWVVDQVAGLHPDLAVVASSPPVNGVFDSDQQITSVERIIPLLREGYDDLFVALSEHADEVALVRDVPKSPDDPATCLSTGNPSLGDCMFEPVERSTVLGDVAVDAARESGIDVVDPTPWLCYQGECPIVIGGTLSYRDTDHITTEYAANLWAELGTALDMLSTSGE